MNITNSSFEIYGTGLMLDGVSDNLIAYNTLENNSNGIFSHRNSGDNQIHHNNFINNTIQANLADDNTNSWNLSYPFGGNFWSNWKDPDEGSGPDQDEPGSDGIVDEEFQIRSDSNIDYYPFTIRDGWKTEISYTGCISGYVFDEEGNPIEFARIGILCSGDDLSTTTNISGFYEMSNLPNGDCDWTVNVSKAGFISQEIEMQISGNSTKNFTLLLESPPHIKDEGDPSDSPFPLPPIFIFSMSVGSVVLMLVAFTEFGRYAFFSLLYPLYTRLSKDKLLENYTRGRIHGLIEGIPGIHYSELLRKLAVGNGNLAYHLKTLEREGIIRTKRVGKIKQFYLSSDPTFTELKSRSETTINFETTSISENPTCTSILELVESNPGLSESEISDLLGIPKQTVNYHIRSQEITGAVRVERNNGITRCYLKK